MNASSSSRGAAWLVRGAFLAYAAGLMTLTHWPRLRIEATALSRPDLLGHMLAFGIWAFLCSRSGWFGARGSARNLAIAAALSVAYGAIDESTQLIGMVGRTARWDDFAGNVIGISVGTALAATLAALDDGRDGRGDGHG